MVDDKQREIERLKLELAKLELEELEDECSELTTSQRSEVISDERPRTIRGRIWYFFQLVILAGVGPDNWLRYSRIFGRKS